MEKDSLWSDEWLELKQEVTPEELKRILKRINNVHNRKPIDSNMDWRRVGCRVMGDRELTQEETQNILTWIENLHNK